MTRPDDLILNPEDEVTIRQQLLLVSLAKRPADLAIEVRLPDGVAVRRSRPPHPLCGCTWQND